MNSMEHAKELFRKLINFSIKEDNLDEKCLIVEELILCDIDFEKKLDNILSKFLGTPSIILLNKLRYYLVKSSQWLTTGQLIYLAGNLVKKQQMTQQEAASLFSNFSHDQKMSLTREELRVIELAEIVNEDFSENFINVNDDDLFFKELVKFT